MVNSAVNRLVNIVGKDMIEEDLEVLAYGIFIMIFSLIEIAVILTVAFFMGKILEAIIFLSILMFLRKRIGGFHSKSYIQCMVLTFLVCFASIYLNELLQTWGSDLISKLILLIGSLLILRFAPKDTENRKFSEEERVLFRIKSLEALCITILLSYLLGLFSERLSGIINVTVLVQGLVIINIRRLLIWKRKLQRD